MQEISPRVFIETGFAGVTLGAINCDHGLILIDAPFRPDDTRAWRASLLNLGGGVERILINLDAHLDRTLGVRAMECTVVGHEKLIDIFRIRPVSFKAQPVESGAEWEQHNGLGAMRWPPPEITFTNRLSLYWDESPIQIEYHPGSSLAAVWVWLPENQVLFVGDAVTPNQPPFLGSADLMPWIDQLNLLLTPAYQSTVFISGRAGVATHEDVRKQIRFLESAQKIIDELAAREAPSDEVARYVPDLLASFQPSPDHAVLYQNRLKYGLRRYYQRCFRPAEVQDNED